MLSIHRHGDRNHGDDRIPLVSSVGSDPRLKFLPQFADPIDWDDQRTYEPFTIVLAPDDKTYMSKHYVPKNVSYTNDFYWAKIGSYETTASAAEAARVAAENDRTAAEQERTAAESERIAAEIARVIAETNRSTAEIDRVSAEADRVMHQSANDTSQSQNNSWQMDNNASQSRNDLDQQRNNEAAASGYVRYLVQGEYDVSTGKPTISAETELRMCISPNPDQDDPDNRMLEWARRYDQATMSWVWELVGSTGMRIDPATTAQADAMWDDDQAVISSNVPDVSWMSYYRTKIKQWITSRFVGINTIARVAQLISSGEVTATKTITEEIGGETVITTEAHNLTDKLDSVDYHRALTWGELKNRFTWGSLMGESQTGDETVTTNLALRKPGYADTVDIDTINDDMDVLDFLAGQIATFETSPATSAHAVGEYLLYSGAIFRVTAAIAIGDSLLLGTNVTPINMGAELTSVNSAVSTLRDSVAYSGNNANAAINRMSSNTQQFGVLATTAESHRVGLIVQTNGVSLFDWNKQGGAGEVWSLLTPNVFMGRGSNPSSLTSLDSTNIEAGTYWINSSSIGGTWPSGRTWGMLLVFRISVSSSLSTQIFVGDGKVYFRQYFNNNWSSWTNLASS